MSARSVVSGFGRNQKLDKDERKMVVAVEILSSFERLRLEFERVVGNVSGFNDRKLSGTNGRKKSHDEWKDKGRQRKGEGTAGEETQVRSKVCGLFQWIEAAFACLTDDPADRNWDRMRPRTDYVSNCAHSKGPCREPLSTSYPARVETFVLLLERSPRTIWCTHCLSKWVFLRKLGRRVKGLRMLKVFKETKAEATTDSQLALLLVSILSIMASQCTVTGPASIDRTENNGQLTVQCYSTVDSQDPTNTVDGEFKFKMSATYLATPPAGRLTVSFSCANCAIPPMANILKVHALGDLGPTQSESH